MSQNTDEDGKGDTEMTAKPNADTKSSTTAKERKNRKEKVKALAKVIVRRLPPSMSEEAFLKQIDPIPEHDYFYFVAADWTLGQNATCRAYINFCQQSDIFIFKDKFDGYVFVDGKGTEYPAIVEFAPFQGLPKGKSRKKDNKANTIDTEPHYLAFLETLQEQDAADGKGEMKMEYSFQIKDDQKITSTPLLEYIANVKQERRDERKRKVEDRKRQREEEKQRKKNQVAKSIPKAIDEEANENDDGIVVRTIKSRPLDRDRGRKDSKQDKEKGSKASEAGNERRRAENEKRDAERAKKQKERQERRDAKRKEDRERHKREKDEKPTKGDSASSSAQPAANKDEKEKVKKYSESRRERRERRAEENNTASASTDKSAKPAKAENSKSSASKGDERKTNEIQRQNSAEETSGDAAQKERSVQNIRNKFRPTLQLYQPGRRRSDASMTSDTKTKAGDKEKDRETTVTSDGGEQQQHASTNADDRKSKTDKKVSRYTERRSKAREKRSNSDANEATTAKNDSAVDDASGDAEGILEQLVSKF